MKRIVWIILITALFYSTSSAFLFFKKKPPRSEKITVSVHDKPYRLIAILPFTNRTGKSEFDYLSLSIPHYLHSALTSITNVIVSTNDIAVAPALLTNTNVILSYDKDFNRTVKVLSMKSVVSLLTQCTACHSLAATATNLAVDYVVYGSFTGSSRDNLSFKTYLYFVQRKSNAGPFELSYHGDALNAPPKIAAQIKAAFYHTPGGALTVTSDPPDALIYANGRYCNRTPFTIEYLPVGTYVITVRKDGWHTQSNTICMTTNGYALTNITLLNARTAAPIAITTSPTNALIMFDARPIGKTPLIVSNLVPGRYRIRLSAPGYINEYHRIRINKTANRPLMITMQPKTRTNEIARIYHQSRCLMWTFTGTGLALTIGAVIAIGEVERNQELPATIAYDNPNKETLINEYYRKETLWRSAAIACGSLSLVSYVTAIIFMIKAANYSSYEYGMILNTPSDRIVHPLPAIISPHYCAVQLIQKQF